jgi:hypothetical protein
MIQDETHLWLLPPEPNPEKASDKGLFRAIRSGDLSAPRPVSQARITGLYHTRGVRAWPVSISSARLSIGTETGPRIGVRPSDWAD